MCPHNKRTKCGREILQVRASLLALAGLQLMLPNLTSDVPLVFLEVVGQ
jgi:hypothetical protein